MIVLINVAAWLCIHLSVAFCTSRLSIAQINRFKAIYHVHPSEMTFYQKILIKKWKSRVGDAASLFKGGVKKKDIPLRHVSGREWFIVETKRAELSHWLQMIPAPLFFLFNEAFVGWLMLLYAIMFNLPLIAIQRYNRFQVIRIMEKGKK